MRNVFTITCGATLPAVGLATAVTIFLSPNGIGAGDPAPWYPLLQGCSVMIAIGAATWLKAVRGR